MSKKNNSDREIEVRFLEVDVENLKTKLLNLGAKDLGLDHLDETIFYGLDFPTANAGKFVRLRKYKDRTELTFKHRTEVSATGTIEHEFEVSDAQAAQQFLEALGLSVCRRVEKKRHTFKLGDAKIDIDFWPKIPPYVEIEGTSEEHLKEIAQKLDLNWSNAVFLDAMNLVEKYYQIPFSKLKYFTFDRIE